MALTPSGDEDVTQQLFDDIDNSQPSLTYEMNFATGQLTGARIDDALAFSQAIRKAFSTPRFKHIIYSPDYGSELYSLIGQDVTTSYLTSEVTRIVTESIIYDDRVESVNVTKVDKQGDKLYIDVTVVGTDTTYSLSEEVVI